MKSINHKSPIGNLFDPDRSSHELHGPTRPAVHMPPGPALNPSVEQADQSRLKAQAKAIYRRFLKGPVSTGELLEMAAQYNSRLKELRIWLKDYGWTIDRIGSKSQANNIYALRPYYGSRYQAMLMKKARKKTNNENG